MQIEDLMQFSSLGNRFDKIRECLLDTLELTGEIWECGVYKGGSSAQILNVIVNNNIKSIFRIFDSFCGMPICSEYDKHTIGTMHPSNMDETIKIFEENKVLVYKGIIPETFNGLENSIIKVAHIDVDQYKSTKDCIEFIWPRLIKNGYVIIDDYNDADCLGAKKAIDDFNRINNFKIITSFHPQIYIKKEN